MFEKIISFIKIFTEKCIFLYKNNESFRDLSVKMLLIIVGFNIVNVCLYYFGIKLEHNGRIWGNLLVFLLRFLESLKILPREYIHPDMSKLPDKIGGHSVSIQYTPPKGLSPSEVGLLYDLKPYSTNFDCLLYKWEYEGLIKIEDRGNGSILLYRSGKINDNVPNYEKKYWDAVFKKDYKNMVVWKWNMLKLDQKEASALHFELLNYCVKQGILYKNQDLLFIISIIGAFGGGFIFGYILGVVVIILSFVYIFSALGKQGKYFGKRIGRTDKGEELLAHIIGYKYWLEKCEEEQVKKILKEDSGFKSKNLPYIVALRMDWKFLNGKFNK